MLFRIFTLLALLCSLNSDLLSGDLPLFTPSRSYLAERSIWNLFYNPAGLAGIDKFSAGVFYRSPFLIDKIAHRGLAVAIPLGTAATSGIGVVQYGYELYRDQQLCLALSRLFGGAVAAGVRFDYFNEKFGGDYQGTSCLTGAAGIIAKLTPDLFLGVNVFNPQKSKQGYEKKPASVSAGLKWAFGETAAIHADFMKASELKSQLSAGIRYSISKKFELMAGLSSGVERCYFGYRFSAGRLRIGMSSGYHGQLGFSPGFELFIK